MAFRATTAASRRLAFSTSTAAALGVSIVVWQYSKESIKNEAPVDLADNSKVNQEAASALPGKSAPALAAAVDGAGPYSPYVWGSNRNLVLSPSSSLTSIKTPRPLVYTGSTPLRDLVLAERYGACVDARGDVWCWGVGYHGDDAEKRERAGRSLRGKDITKLSPAPSKIFALSSRSGKIYTISSSRQQQLQRDHDQADPWWMLSLGRWFRTDPGVDFVEVNAEGGLKSGEKFVDIAAGRHHVLALTSKGRTFSMPASSLGNSHFQLGTRVLPSSDTKSLLPTDESVLDIRYNTTLNPINSLSSIPVSQISAGDRTSFVRTSPEGRVLGFGANEFGQIGLGAMVAVDVVPTPTEIVLAKGYRGGTIIKCLDVAAGGNNTFFTVERSSPQDDGKTFVDVLAVGSGVHGTLGNGLWSSVSGQPTKVKTVSGLQEYSEAAKSFIPIQIFNMAISQSPTPHAIATLNTVAQSDAKGVSEGTYGNDVMVWGAGGDYQLGNGKRSNLAIPQHLPPLAGPGRAPSKRNAETQDKIWESGTISPMPHSRLQLRAAKADAYDPEGRLIKRNVKVQETVVAGWHSSAVYYKVQN